MALDIDISYPTTTLNPEGSPLPYQDAFHHSKTKYRLNAGGFGTGGTTTICLELLKELLKYPNNYGLLGRKDLGELKSTTLKEFLDITPKEIIANHNKQDKTVKLINGSELFYLNMDDAIGAVDKIKSLNLGVACIDQLEEIDETIFLAIKGRLRRANSSKNFFAKCNPEGHNWMWRIWKGLPFQNYLRKEKINIEIAEKIIARVHESAEKRILIHEASKIIASEFHLTPKQVETVYDKSQYELFEATTLENFYLPQDYVNELLAYPEKWKRRYVYCSWDDFEGLVYNEFNEKLHVIDYYEPKELDAHVFALDYGFRNPTAILFAATDFDGTTIIYDEYYQAGKLVSYISDELKKNKFWKKAYKLADPSIHKTERDGNSVADDFAKNGVSFEDADNSVTQGINKVNELFKSGKLKIARNCINLLRELGNYKWRELKPGQARNEYEEPVKRDDHACDSLRYLANHISVPIEDKRPKDWDKPARTGHLKARTQAREYTF